MATVELSVGSYSLGKYVVERETGLSYVANLGKERQAIAAEIKSAVERTFGAYGIEGEVVLK